MTQQLRGVLPVLQTPFTDDEELDLAAVDREIAWAASCGVDGVVTGMVSEVLRLHPSEHLALAERVVDAAAAHGLPAVISVGAESTHVAVRNAREASSLGAAGVMAIPPLATALEEDQQAAYYGAIVEAVDVPVVVQDASGYVGQPLSIALQARLHAEYGTRVMFKPEAAPIAPRVSALRDATGGGAAVLEGTGGLALVDSHRRGIVGTMPGTDVCWALVALWAALEAGDQERVATVSGPLVGLIALQHSLDAFLAVEKHLLRRQGVFGNEVVRGPVGYRMDDETRADVDRLFTLLHHAVHGRELVDA